MVETNLSRIIDNIDTVFRGDAWHGPSVMEIINSLPESKLKEKPSISKQSIAQNIFHLTAYRRFVIEKLEDNIHFRLETDEENWGTEEDLNDPVRLKENLLSTHMTLLKN